MPRHIKCIHAELLQSFPTLCDAMDCSPPGSSIHGILQARILKWVAVPSSRETYYGIPSTHITLLILLSTESGGILRRQSLEFNSLS